MHSFSRTEINKIHLIDAQSCGLKVIRFCSQTPQTLRPTPDLGKNLLLGTAPIDTYVKKRVTRISLGLSLKTEKSTVKADKGAVVNNQLRKGAT